MLMAYAAPVVAVLALGRAPWVLLPLASMPLAAVLLKKLATSEGRPLNAVLARTAMLLLVYGALFAGGLVLS
jgi:1,4-dihydroxy-2-naphthoate octaprenyltransferase